MDIDGHSATSSSLPDALQDREDRRQVICGRRVENYVGIERVLCYQCLVLQIAHDGRRSRCGDAIRMLLSSDQTINFIALGTEQVDYVPAYEAWPNDEYFLTRHLA